MIKDTTRLHPAATGSPTPEYKPRNPRKTSLWQILDSHFDTFLAVYEGVHALTKSQMAVFVIFHADC